MSTLPTQTVQPPERADLRTYWSLVGTMFQGAFSDNLFRFILMMLLLDHANQVAGHGEAGNRLGSAYQAWVGVAWALPWILSVSLAGWLSNRFSKARVTQGTKMMEIGVMGLACLAFATEGVWFAIGIMFLMALQSALFGPSKYGILPEILPEKRVAWGNGLLQGMTFVAILAGTIIGPWLYGTFRETLWMAGLVLVGCAGAGLAISLTMRPVPAANPAEELSANPFAMVWRYGREILNNPGLKWAVTGMVVFWLVGLVLQLGAVQLLKNVLRVDDMLVGVALFPIVVGNGFGCFLVSYLSRNRIELGLVPFGALAIFLTGMLTWYLTPVGTVDGLSDEAVARLKVVLPLVMGLVGASCGAFIVPLQSYIVAEADPRVRGGVYATANLFVACGWLVGGGALYPAIVWVRGNPGDVFLFCAVLMLLTAVVICWRFPRIPLRFMIVSVLSPFYRIRVAGVENIPATGGAVLAPNHQSYLDGILLASVIDRPVRFIMSRRIYNKWFVYHFARMTNSIAIEQAQSPRELIASLREASEEVKRGGLVCIFPEGQLTRIGMVQGFRRGIERIMKGLEAPVIPIAIDGAYNSRWALRGGKPRFLKNIRLGRGRLHVAIGGPMAADTPLHQLREAVNEQMITAFDFRREAAEPLHRAAIRSLRSQPLARLYADHVSPGKVPNVRLLAGIALIGQRLKKSWGNEKFVGLLLPPSLGTSVINIAALTAGKVPVNLNYTVSPGILKTICETAEIRVIITSREFLQKANIEPPSDCTIVYAEELRKDVGKVEMLGALVRGLLWPIGALEKRLGRSAPAELDDLATLVFSSGSTGVPKGVMLTHWNIWSNSVGALQYLDYDPKRDSLLGALPFFHSFGYTAGLWLPLIGRFPIVFHPNPLDGKAIGSHVEKYRITHLFATPTFLSTYLRRVDPGQFGSLRFVMTGAEKLRDYIADGFEKRFGIRPIEGFGCTECSPIVSLNTLDWRGPGIYQAGTSRNSVGRPIPGCILRIEDLETGEPVPPGNRGMLLVKGHNVMQGYYKMEDKTKEALRDGWYITGDVAEVDEDGFLMIRDRLSRFSKIGGEMVPHVRIEEALQQIAGAEEPVFAVTGLPDEKRGERLVVLYATEESTARDASEKLADPDVNIPSLWQPRWQDFIHVDEIPVLGSGKLDLKRIRQIAEEAASAS